MTPDDDVINRPPDDPLRTAAGTGTTDPSKAELTPGEEPVTTGTLFLTTIILILIGAIWVIVYARLLDR